MKRIPLHGFSILLAIAFCVPTPAAMGQDEATLKAPARLSIDTVVQLALENNLELRAAGGRVGAAAGRARQAKAWANPELELSAEDWPTREGNGFRDSKRTLGISQSLPFPGKKSLDRQIGAAGVKRSEADLQLRQSELVREVRVSFCRVLAAEERLSTSSQLVESAEAAAGSAAKRVDSGAAPYQEQLRAEVLLEQARMELASSKTELGIQREALAALVGRPEISHAPLGGTLNESPSASLMGAAGEKQLSGHPSLGTARANLEQAELGSRRAGLEPYPDLKVGVAGGRVGEKNQSIVQVGVSLPLPILDRGRGLKQEARANVQVAVAELQSMQQQLRRDWIIVEKRYRSAADQVLLYQQRILPKAAEALRLVQTGFEQGKFNFMDLVDTQRSTTEVRLAYLQKLLEMNTAQIELESILCVPAVPGDAKSQ